MARTFFFPPVYLLCLLLGLAACVQPGANVGGRQNGGRIEHGQDLSAHQRALLTDANKRLVSNNFDGAIDLLREGMLASGFAPPFIHSLAYALELRGDFHLANAVRLGPDLGQVPDFFTWSKLPARAVELVWLPLHIEAAAGFFRRRPHIEPMVAVFFDFLDRKFGLPWAREIAVRVDLNGSPYLQLLRPLLGLRNEIAALPSELGPNDRDIFPALYCNQLPLPQGYFAMLFWSSQQGGYELTHAAGALEWVRERECIEDESKWFALKHYQLEQMALQAAESSEVDDLFAETIAFLYYTGGRALVEPGWVARLAASQRADGGWGTEVLGPADNHMSLLALWGLLEAANQDRPSEKMLRD